MGRRRLLLLLKPVDAFPGSNTNASCAQSLKPNPKALQVLKYRENRRKVHTDAINFCQDILRKKNVDWTPFFRSTLSQPIRDVDLVVTIGGDGTLLQASHFIDDTVPVLGVNSDPTRTEEMVDNILAGQTIPSKLSRMSISVNSKPFPTYALNDVLIAHPCPATLSRFSFRIRKEGQPLSPLVNSRSSGFRVSTAIGSTAAMLSSGGFAMPVLSKDLQYIVREPILSRSSNSSQMDGLVKPDESMETSWFCKKGSVFVDGSHVVYPIRFGDTVELTSTAPVLNVFLPSRACA